MPSSRGPSKPRDRTQVSCTAGRFFTDWATRGAQANTQRWPKGASGLGWHTQEVHRDLCRTGGGSRVFTCSSSFPHEEGWKVLCWASRAAPSQDPFSPEGRGAQAEGTEPTEKAPSYTGHLSVGPGPPVSHRMSDHLGSLCFYCYTQGMEVPLDHAWHVCFQKGCVTWTLFFLLLHEGPRCRRVAQACLCECPWAPVYLNKGAGKVPKWSNSSNSLFPAWHWPALQPFIITNKILMHFIYALMNFIINTINALTRLRHNTSWI